MRWRSHSFGGRSRSPQRAPCPSRSRTRCPPQTTWQVGHAYAHRSNRMWPLLRSTGIAPPEHIKDAYDDDKMPALAGVVRASLEADVATQPNATRRLARLS